MRKFLTALFLVLAASTAGAAPAADAGSALHALFDSEWERGLREDPLTASFYGDLRWNDQWPDISPKAIEASHAGDLAALEALKKIDRAALSAADQLNYDLFQRQLQTGVDGYRFKGWEMPVNQMGGIQSTAEIAESLQFRTTKDYADWVARMERFGGFMDQTIALMRAGMKSGRTPPKVILGKIPDQVKAQVVTKPEDSPFYLPFVTMSAEVPAAEQERLRSAARAAISTVVVPQYQRFATFFSKEYLPKCHDKVGIGELPDGKAWYAFQVQRHTTTDMTPEQIHTLGLAEVARIHGEMLKIMEQVGFKGSFKEFLAKLRSDPQFYFTDPQQLFDAYALIAKRIDPELPKLFGKLPRTPYGVRPVPEASAPAQTTAYYNPPSADGKRAGYYYVNLYKPETRKKYEMEALTAHESVPGHHLQIALATELGELPMFRRTAGYTAYVEGWGLYSESLGGELGLYKDPYSKFGQLTYEMWRAVRLVVDTGMHSKGWSRDQAIQFFSDNAAKDLNDITVEIDRYLAWPGQALAYKVGELKIKELRARASTKLGAKFDVRAFHDVVLGSGAVPLSVLERNVDAWIATQAGSTP